MTHFLCFLFEFLDGSLVDTSAFVNQVTSGGGLARVDVANNDNVDVCLFLSHYKFLAELAVEINN